MTSDPPPAMRTVRFAPLPDTRRPLASLVSDEDSSSSTCETANPKRSNYPIESYPSPPVAPLPPHQPSQKRRSILLPFFRKSCSSGSASPSSSVSLTPTASFDNNDNQKHASRRFNITAEEILTLGTINLFRSGSRSGRPVDGNWDHSRWSAHQSAPSLPPSTCSSVTRSQTFISAGDNNRGSKRHFFSSGQASSQNTSRKGVRMLNGRVYGAPKRHSNPFDNIKDETDPEFVEWGYGGMGSVRGRHAAGMGGTRWERLHSGEEPSLDDGSGMGWLKKRREAREKEREQGGAEIQPEIADAGVSNSTLTTPLTRPASADSSSTPRPSHMEAEHILQSITIPANFQRHHHHRSTSKTIIPEGSNEPRPGSADRRAVENRGSESESEESGEEEESSEDESDSSEPERRTAVGAGVEKYARHKDVEAA